jgi:hypothetical protein
MKIKKLTYLILQVFIYSCTQPQGVNVSGTPKAPGISNSVKTDNKVRNQVNTPGKLLPSTETKPQQPPGIAENNNNIKQPAKTVINNQNPEVKKEEIKPSAITGQQNAINPEAYNKDELIPNSSNTTSPYKPQFDIAREVNPGTRNAHMSIFFRDNHKVRLAGPDTRTFKSLAGSDLSLINTLISQYNIKTIDGVESTQNKSEEELAQEEKQAEGFYGIDYPNKASIYYFYAENINVKEFIEKLRQEPVILSANEDNG